VWAYNSGVPSELAGEGENPWAHVDELKRVAHRYLDEHHHDPPKIRKLPVARYEVIRDPAWFAQRNQPRCGARGRIESYMYGSSGTDVLSCARPKFHPGRHTAEPIGPTFFRLGWKVPSWESMVDDDGPSTLPEINSTSQHEPVLAPLSKRDRWQNRISLVGVVLGVLLAAVTGPLLVNGLLWQSGVCYIIAFVLLAGSWFSRMQLLRRNSGR
jgi:hypothetical protein